MGSRSRRGFLRDGLAFAAGARALRAGSRKFTLAFVPRSIGIRADQGEAIELAAKHGFESVQPFGAQLLREGSARYAEAVSKAGLQWAAASLPFRLGSDGNEFKYGLAQLPRVAEALREAGATRVGTPVSASSDALNYLDNFKLHAGRLRQIGAVLADSGLRLGLEYLGTKHLWTARKHAFVHSLAECRQLIAEAGQANIGVVVDSWHWWTAHETADDILQLSNADVVSADLNDAPVGIERERQLAHQRELPVTTGMIDARAFLGALLKIGYDGPIRAEPFNQRLDAMDDDQASAATVAAMRNAFALLG